MAYIMYKGKKYSSLNSKNISFDNSNTDLNSNNVEDSINEINNKLKWKRLSSINGIGNIESNFIQLPNEWNECHIEIYISGGVNVIYSMRLLSFDSYGYYRAGHADGDTDLINTTVIIIGFRDNKIFLENSKINGIDFMNNTTIHLWYR